MRPSGLRYPNLAALGLALLLCALSITLSKSFVLQFERKHVSALRHSSLDLKISGSALARAAFHRTELLPIIGASEVLSTPSVYQPSIFFKHFPTGFAPFEIARGGAASLTEAGIVAGLGEELRGKKVVISFSPISFREKRIRITNFKRNFSTLHATQLIYGPTLDFATKQLAASRLRLYSTVFKNRPLLSFGIHALDHTREWGKLKYYAALPLGLMQLGALELEDHILSLEALWGTPAAPAILPRSQAINWTSTLDRATEMSRRRTTSNPYGVGKRAWKHHFLEKHFVPKAPGSKDTFFTNRLRTSEEWDDFRLLLHLLRAQGARVLLLSRPFKGALYDAKGISIKSRQFFYNKMRAAATHDNVALVDFHQYDDDLYFTMDGLSHTGHRGWIFINKILDQFYHDHPLHW